MKFKDWFAMMQAKDPKFSRAEVARRLGCSATHVRQLILESGRPPSLVLMKRIKVLSGGKCDLKDWDSYPVEYMPATDPEVA